ncbi:MAG: hypothetical protein A2W01_06680 [Candidatus Solincola sediminis]|uniref:UPF0033 domain-containing protein n=1 Tax=Candidatus Solincola sediminis TaxID=1797199 RepID=A0A1F2WEX4_9ACTN|nr:MAG: hypothetical protein A2Y75_09800 [Candidatus Solincola sediminis]OFW59137.1 MAG: hypothetical protein A2W01_06680 [Candidatus Solincola sediminis]
MSKVVDARGLVCPQPVVRTREALGSADEIEVLVDNKTARENVSRFASNKGCAVRVEKESGFYRLIITGRAETGEQTREPGEETRNVIILSSELMGPDEELGRVLMRTFLNTMCESESFPWRLVLFNRGVLLALEGEDTAEALANLACLGVDVLVCGTCLDYFKVKECLAAGRVSNMYEIVETMLMATNSATI